jgi:hypothetical protein
MSGAYLLMSILHFQVITINLTETSRNQKGKGSGKKKDNLICTTCPDSSGSDPTEVEKERVYNDLYG